jgi:hypothetical protein
MPRRLKVNNITCVYQLISPVGLAWSVTDSYPDAAVFRMK